MEIVVPALRPILPWLVLKDSRILDRVIGLAPEILFEGGDPSHLSLSVRRSILIETCERIAHGNYDSSIQDFSAVQRFSKTDLESDIRVLLGKYKRNENVSAFLMQMVWKGKLSGLKADVLKVALSPSSKPYARLSAIKAVSALGDSGDFERLRTAISKEKSAIPREVFTEILVMSYEHRSDSAEWLFKCLENVEPARGYESSYLSEALSEYLERVSEKSIPSLLSGIANALNQPPLTDGPKIKASKKYLWIIAPACKAILRLIRSRSEAALKEDSLSIMGAIGIQNDYGLYGAEEVRADLTRCVSAWPELKYALFWNDVRNMRAQLLESEKGRLTDHWNVSVFRTIWSFDEADFDVFLNDIIERQDNDDKLVALSVAFKLYKECNRPDKWRRKLNKTVKSNPEAEEILKKYLNPPAESAELKRYKEEEKKWERNRRARERERQSRENDWIEFLNDNVKRLHGEQMLDPAAFTSPLLYLMEWSRESMKPADRWSGGSFANVKKKFGKKISSYYRDSAVAFWRSFDLKIRSDGAPMDKIPYTAVFGLVGLEIESSDSPNWLDALSPDEVVKACRFASYELNGFPTWFTSLYSKYPGIVGEFLLQEIQYELSISSGNVDRSYMLHDVAWEGKWSWEFVGPALYRFLEKNSPSNMRSLEQILTIVQGSALTDSSIAKLAQQKIASGEEEKDVLAVWYAVWVGVEPEKAIPSFTSHLKNISEHLESSWLAMRFVAQLVGGWHGRGTSTREAYKEPSHLKALFVLMNEYIRREEDIDRTNGGVYSPELRDTAQDARGRLFTFLNQMTGKAAFMKIMEIANSPPTGVSSQLMHKYAKDKATLEGDSRPWKPEQIPEFDSAMERTPQNIAELANLALLRLTDLKHDLEYGNDSIAETLQKADSESELRIFIGRELKAKSRERYIIGQEEEMPDEKRTDIRFHGARFTGQVPLELKLAENWAGSAHLERLRNQLCGDYMRDAQSKIGFFLVVKRGRGRHMSWILPGSNKRLDFAGLVDALGAYWLKISAEFPNINDVFVVGIDLTARGGKSRYSGRSKKVVV